MLIFCKQVHRMLLLAAGLAVAARPGYGQAGAGATPAAGAPTAAISDTTVITSGAEAKEAVGVTQGVPLPTGVGYFANADNYHNLTLGVQAGLGVSEKSPTFGYDNLAVSTRWKLGDNALGRRLSFLAGFSDWRIPAYRKVFPDSVIDPLPKQDRFAAQSATAASFGLSLSFGRNDPTTSFNIPALRDSVAFLTKQITDAKTTELTPTIRKRVLKAAEKHKVPLTEADLDPWTRQAPSATQQANLTAWGYNPTTTGKWLAVVASTIEIDSLRAKRRRVVLQSYRDVQLRRDQHLGVTVGTLFRLADFSTETDVQAYDLFATVARGFGTTDVVVAGHYLHYFDNTLPQLAFTGAAGVYARLSDNGPTPVMGLTASYGHYAFRELHDVITEARKFDRNPHTNRFDVVLSYSGAPDKENQTSAGLGIRYSRLMPSLLPAYNAFSLVFSSNFSLVK